MKKLSLIVFALLCCNPLIAVTDIFMKSPQSNISARVLVKGGQLFYTVTSGKETLISLSPLGITVDHYDYGKLISNIQLEKKQTIRESYSIRGKHMLAENYCNAYRIKLHKKGSIEFRLFEDGCAFRYLIDNASEAKISEEKTSFTMPAGSRVWYFERNNDWKLKSYAGLWQSTTVDSLPIVSLQGPIQGKPLVVQLKNDTYMALTEAALSNYSGLRFNAIGSRRLQVNFTEGKAGFSIRGEIKTPWRVVIYAKDLNALVNTNIITSLNPAPDKKLYPQTSYIKPGRSVWSWLTRNKESDYMQPASEMAFIDAAQQLGFEYSMIDEGWETKWPDKWKQLKELCNYGRARNVSVWVWKHSKDNMNQAACDAFLDSVKAAGAVGIKTDFMNSEAKPLIDFEIAFLKACAKRSLMVNFHGCQAPSGESRTYPNELTREGVRGMELNILDEPIPAWHNAALPFTRFLCGHGDYTPGYFSNKANTTYVHQLAMFYLLESSFQCLADNPAFLFENKNLAPIVEALEELPASWDETLVLPGSSIGKLAAIARRKGDVWYVAVINGTVDNMSFSISPSFLQTQKEYMLVSVSDRKSDVVSKEKEVLSRSDTLNYQLLPNGGLVLIIKPNNKI